MKFRIEAWNPDTQEARTFLYDNTTNALTDSDGTDIAYPPEKWQKDVETATVFDASRPLRKSSTVRVLKIQLGLSCNYGCEYCSQRFVPRPDETSAKDIERFLSMLDALTFDEAAGLKIEFWGGEPFVYVKTLKPLAEALRERFDHWRKAPIFSVITNGSLLTREHNDWLVLMGFQVGLSHDGPGQHVRGPDPLDDPQQRAIILNLYKRLAPMGRMSFNPVLNAHNQSRAAIQKFFVELTGDENVPLGEGELIDAYDEGGLAVSMRGAEEHAAFRRAAFNDIRDVAQPGKRLAFVGVLSKINRFTNAVLSRQPAVALAQKCGMDDEHVLTLDLRGNVLTCQNTSAVATAPNGRQHLSGHVSNMDAVRVRSSRHWSQRPDCANCPVLHLCQGACMYLEDERWQASCAHAYSDNVVLFALAFEHMTRGFVPMEIVSSDPSFPADRRDVWGTLDPTQATSKVEAAA